MTRCRESDNEIFSVIIKVKQFQLIILFIKFDVKKTLKKRWKRDKFAYACALYSRKSRKKLLNIGMKILFEPLLRHYIIKVDIFF